MNRDDEDRRGTEEEDEGVPALLLLPSIDETRRDGGGIVDFDAVLDEVGSFGKYQKLVYVLMFFPIVMVSALALVNVFVAAVPDSRCFVPACDDHVDDGYPDAFSPDFGFFANFAIPLDPKEAAVHSPKWPKGFDKCHLFKPFSSSSGPSGQCQPEAFDANQTVPCSYSGKSTVEEDISHPYEFLQSGPSARRPETKRSFKLFDTSLYTSTIVSEWDLTCEDAWKVPFVKSLFFFGVMVSAPLSGLASDRFGRLPTLVAAFALLSLCGIPAGASSSLAMYAGLNFFIAFTQLTVYQTTFIYAVEMVGTSHREMASTILMLYFVAGELYLALVAYLTKEWRTILYVLTCPMPFFVLYRFFLRESVRWLVSRARYEEAEAEVVRIAAFNGRPVQGGRAGLARFAKAPGRTLPGPGPEVDEEQQQQQAAAAAGRAGQWQTFKSYLGSSPLLARQLNTCYAWFVSAAVYYGLSMNASELAPGDPYLNFTLVSLVEIPGYFASQMAMVKVGRRPALVGSFAVCSLACLAIGILCWTEGGDTDASSGGVQAASLVIFLLGKLGITAAFAVVYLYSSEILPTDLRTFALGFCSMCARVGALLSPYIAELKMHGDWLPLVVFGALAAMAAVLAIFLPETKGRQLPQTVQDALALGRAPDIGGPLGHPSTSPVPRRLTTPEEEQSSSSEEVAHPLLRS